MEKPFNPDDTIKPHDGDSPNCRLPPDEEGETDTAAEQTASLERRNRELAALNAISTAVSHSLDLSEVLDTAVEHTLALFDMESAVVLMVDERAGRLLLRASRGTPSHLSRTLGELKLEESLCGQVVLIGQPLVVRDVAHDPRELAETQRSDLSFLALTPLKMGDQVLGVLAIASHEPRTFAEEDERFLEAIGRQVSIGMENARLHEETQRRLEAMIGLHQTSLDITAELDLQEVLQAILERAKSLLRAQGGGVYLYDPDRDELILTVNSISQEDYAGVTLKLGEGMGGRVALTGEPIILDNYSEWEERSSKPESDSFTAAIAVPMKWQGRIIGTINIFADAEERTFTPEDVALLGSLADQAAIAIANARLFEEARRSSADLREANKKLENINAQLLALYQVSTATSGELDMETVQQRIADRVIRNLGFDIVLIARVDAKKRSLSHPMYAGIEPSLRRQVESMLSVLLQSGIPLDASENLAIKAGRLDKIEITHDLYELLRPTISRDVASTVQDLLGIRAIAVVPLITKASLAGMVAAMTFQPEVDHDMLTALRIFASQAASAIANARLFESVIGMAEQIEQQNKELLETRDRLVKAERLAAIGQIGLTIRHEINNPLTGILGLAQWLLEQDSDLSDSARDDLKMIEEMAVRIRDIVKKLETAEDRTTVYLGDAQMIDLH
ncbi:MAG: GAF domain-containing protein [Chloroflexota bacterium]|nr:GAF domain-containing protein [Chloroflexota bacterium]